MRICIDPGHSGPVEPGACAGGITEEAVNLAIALLVGSKLAAQGHDVIYTRSGDIHDDGLAFRAAIANDAAAHRFVSIHCNGAESPAAHGVEVFSYPGSAGGRLLAEAIQQELAAAAYTADRGVKEADFAALRLTDMAAVLVECGFLTSKSDRAVLASPSGQEMIAAAIARGIVSSGETSFL